MSRIGNLRSNRQFPENEMRLLYLNYYIDKYTLIDIFYFEDFESSTFLSAINYRWPSLCEPNHAVEAVSIKGANNSDIMFAHYVNYLRGDKNVGPVQYWKAVVTWLVLPVENRKKNNNFDLD